MNISQLEELRDIMLSLISACDVIEINSKSIYRTYYNPDSQAGGQLVYERFDRNVLFEAYYAENPSDYITEHSNIELVDITDEDFVSSVRALVASIKVSPNVYMGLTNEVIKRAYDHIKAKSTKQRNEEYEIANST